jgi:hypothetical protein
MYVFSAFMNVINLNIAHDTFYTPSSELSSRYGGLDTGCMVWVSNPGRDKNITLFRPAVRPTQVPTQIVPRFSPEDKAVGA